MEVVRAIFESMNPIDDYEQLARKILRAEREPRPDVPGDTAEEIASCDHLPAIQPVWGRFRNSD